jgi:hypothetical protein
MTTNVLKSTHSRPRAINLFFFNMTLKLKAPAWQVITYSSNRKGRAMFFILDEPLSNYRPGGLHPVHLNDKFHNGRYEVVKKLGGGEHSTMWLARDLK